MLDPGLFLMVTHARRQASVLAIRRFVERYRASAIRDPDAAMQALQSSGAWMGVLILEDVSPSDAMAVIAAAAAHAPKTPTALVMGTLDYPSTRPRVARMQSPLRRLELTPFMQRALAHELIACEVSVQAVVAFARQHNLTVREVEILSAAIAGIDRKEYLEATGMAENTLKRQVQSLLRKSGYTGLERTAIAVLRAGLLGATDSALNAHV